MARSPATTPSLLLLILLLLFSPSTLSLSLGSPSPASTSADFLSTLRSTIDQIQKVISLVSTFSDALGGGDTRLSSAVSDCLDLLDLSSDELTLTLSTSHAASSTASTTAGTGNCHSDLLTWMSAALGNQDTCKEGLDDTDNIFASLVAAGLEVVTSLVSDGLNHIDGAAAGGGDFFEGGGRRRRLLQVAAATTVADAVVAQDGSGNYTTVSAALAAAPNGSERRYVIYVKKGVYRENVEVKKKKWNLMIVGDGMGKTIISGNRSYVDGWTTYRSATFAVAGKGFIARDLTIENTAGPAKHQAVALRSDSDLSVFYRCSFLGYQDTLYAHSLRHFYRDCLIAGTVDFVFGNAAAVFQNCTLLARRPLPNQKNTLTAHGRKDPNQNTGFSFQHCNVSAEYSNSLVAAPPNRTAVYTYLGRPWKEYSRTVFMQSYIGAAVRPEGWLEWDGDFALSTLYYGEYMNYGPGSELRGRVRWPGYHAINDSALAFNFTVSRFIDGDLWLPSTGVKYTRVIN